MWQTIQGTLIGTVLPPKLLAAIYGILATDPAVHFDKSVTDNAGQTGVGFYAVEGVWRYEIMINPSTYAYMGSDYVASIREAEREGWLGEIEGLKISLAGADDKLGQIDRRTHGEPVNLGMPTWP